MKPLLSIKNKKLGFIHSFSLFNPQCIKRDCWKYCYMRRLEKLRPNIKAKNLYNLKVSKSKLFKSRLICELSDSTDLIRLHVDGDFYSQKYLNDIIEIVKEYPNKTFYTYTNIWRNKKNERHRNIKPIINGKPFRTKRTKQSKTYYYGFRNSIKTKGDINERIRIRIGIYRQVSSNGQKREFQY